MKSKAKASDDSIDQYTHDDSKRPNNPPVGLVTPGTDPDQPSKKYSYDPRMDPQLQWSGKQENSEFEVDTVSLHVHERIDPMTILEKAMKPKQSQQQTMFHYFETPENNPPLRDAIEFYKHDQNWSNRLIAGDSLLVMNSLLEKEGMEGKVQMIYIDPPYGIKYGSNFQPFVNKRDVKDGKDEDLTQEPETIKAFRDTWELGVHSYLTYLQKRLILAKKLLNETGSIFIQISDENVHHVREILDEVFGVENFISQISFKKTVYQETSYLANVYDIILWYGKDKKNTKIRKLYQKRDLESSKKSFDLIENIDGSTDRVSKISKIPKDSKLFRASDLTSKGISNTSSGAYKFEGTIYNPKVGNHWKTNPEGLDILAKQNRLIGIGKTLCFKKYLDDFPVTPFVNVWNDTIQSTFASENIFVVQTYSKVIQRCLLMTTDPGDLVFDPTCGSGTTAYVAEKGGRRWITCDSSRISISLAKQRIMTKNFDYYELQFANEGINSNFNYEEVSHITLKSLTSNSSLKTEKLFDHPIIDKSKTRISGPFTVEAVPSPTVKSIDVLSNESESISKTNQSKISSQEQWRNELLKTGIRAKGGQKIEFSRVESHPVTKWLHADAETKEESPKRVMVSFGPEHSPLEQRQVALAIEEARSIIPNPKMIIFAAMQFDPEAAKDIDELNWPDVTVLKVEMNKDLLTEDLKKKRSSNESFWLMGQPDVQLKKTKDKKYIITVNGFDYYNTKTDKIESGDSSKIAMWMLDTDYDGRSVYPQQVFFPMEGKTGGWSKLAKTLQSQIDEELITKYQGTESIPFEEGFNKRAAVKIIDDMGIESLKIIKLE